MEPRAVIAIVLWALGPLAGTDDLPWPLGASGGPESEVLTTYGELERLDSNQSGSLHLGVDLGAQPGDYVYAIEAGTVRRVDDTDPMYSGIAVEAGSTGRGLAYWHLEPGSIPFAVGDEVHVDDVLGRVAEWTTSPGFDHLHLGRVEGVPAEPSDAHWIDHHALSDPLQELAPGWDDEPPVIDLLLGPESADPLPCAFRANDPTGPELGSATHPLAGDVDVVARIWDLCAPDAKWKTVPRSIELTLHSCTHGEVRWHLLLDGPLEARGTDFVYAQHAPFDSLGWQSPESRDFYLVLTAGGRPPETDPTEADAWDAAPGTWELTIVATDAAGNATCAHAEVTIP